jgi:hypothetical protein
MTGDDSHVLNIYPTSCLITQVIASHTGGFMTLACGLTLLGHGGVAYFQGAVAVRAESERA